MGEGRPVIIAPQYWSAVCQFTDKRVFFFSFFSLVHLDIVG